MGSRDGERISQSPRSDSGPEVSKQNFRVVVREGFPEAREWENDLIGGWAGGEMGTSGALLGPRLQAGLQVLSWALRAGTKPLLCVHSADTVESGLRAGYCSV